MADDRGVPRRARPEPPEADGRALSEPLDDPAARPRKRPGLLSRAFVIAVGLVFVVLAGTMVKAGGVIGIGLGVVTLLAGLAFVAIGAGVVEWWSARRRSTP